MRLGSLLASILLFVSVLAFGADVDGKWTGTVSTPNGDFPVNFTFKADDTKLTGAMLDPQGSEIPIADGKIDGSNISFSITLDFGQGPFKLTYKGVVSADQIKFSGDAGGQAFEFVVKKAQ